MAEFAVEVFTSQPEWLDYNRREWRTALLVDRPFSGD
jgi:hypothetical protein